MAAAALAVVLCYLAVMAVRPRIVARAHHRMPWPLRNEHVDLSRTRAIGIIGFIILFLFSIALLYGL
jgi:hypothetical protein